jgi:rhodanese-related sulfurtransferase
MYSGRVLLAPVLLSLFAPAPAPGADTEDDVYDLDNLRVGITADLPYVVVRHAGQPVTLLRHQDPAHRIESPYDQTARSCPPFCIQPMHMPGGVETIGELDLIDYLRRASAGDDEVLVIDARTPDWTARGTIPGSVNVPYTRLDSPKATPMDVAELLEFDFGAVRREGFWSFGAAKTLVFFDNGPWCGQAPTNIKALLDLGYPASKLKWYRGGLQVWEALGLTTVRPPQEAEATPVGDGAHP